jgi:gp16 family phage-associated protein
MKAKTPRADGLRTPAQVRAWLRANGVTLGQFCETHGFNRLTASDLLRGRRKGYYGEAHRVAVALGMKADPKEIEL